jgi:hypothetical protein
MVVLSNNVFLQAVEDEPREVAETFDRISAYSTQ